MITGNVAVIAVLLAVLAALFTAARHPAGQKLFGVVPLLVFAYFVPTLLSNLGVIPQKSPVYDWITDWLLPASLILITLSVDIPAMMRLGKPALIMFFTATTAIFVSGPLAFLLLGWMVPADISAEAWKGAAALTGSWIGGAVNFLAVGRSLDASDSILSLMAVVDVAVASVWMAILLYFAGRANAMDERIQADDSAVVELRDRVQTFREKTTRPASLADLLVIAAISMGGSVLAHELASHLPTTEFIKTFVWVTILATTFGVIISFTPMRNLEGAGASTVGSVFLYLLVTSIGAKAEFARVLDAPVLLLIGIVWMILHAIVVLAVRRWLRLPIFFAAVGSQANVGGAASAPVVAAAFHPALAPVGVILAVGGYVLGTYVALVCAFFFERIHALYF